MREVINPKNVHWPLGYSHIVKVGDTVHVSGQLPLDQEGNIVGKGDMAAQTEKTYENLKRCLETVGATMYDIVMLRIFVTNLDEFDKTRDIRKKYFGKYRPATTGLEISRLYFPDAMIEVDAMAVIGSGASEEAIKPKSI
ncbi:MAG: RidA family protein [Deltaproteobacteria bacterium]|nr:RidA family protein [Deltaproteobacteria bacterium]MBW2138974.1 RidA family protein [Deltaproteobacteria bacterium]